MTETLRWRGAAPANIALIKYMGKIARSGDGLTNVPTNVPTNASLSYTLPHLRTHVELELVPGAMDRWEPLPGFPVLDLTAKGRERFLKHLAFLKTLFGFDGSFVVRSANDFPGDCGLASSASSFAALTLVGARAMTALTNRSLPSREELAQFSRQGSGSSCRSFFAPWSRWEGDKARAEELPFGDLIHQVIIVADGKKAVSSSEAHRRVTESLLFQGRPERAEVRLRDLVEVLRANDWQSSMEVCWSEFWDMHALFETARPSFGYMQAGSLEVLSFFRNQIWNEYGDGPIVTMDAGANVHALYRRDSVALAQKAQDHFSRHSFAAPDRSKYQVISSEDLARKS